MDPNNNTPNEPNVANPAPAAPSTASVTVPAPADLATPATPADSVAPAIPADSSTPAAPAVNADVANAALNPPVNPVVTPGANATASNAAAPNTAAPNAGATMSMNQMFQPQPATQANVLDETTAISVPEGPKPPDPVEEELKAPLKAAGPVPGSIGSAVSMPPADGAAPVGNPQMPADGTNPMAAGPQTPAGKKPNIFDKLTAKTKMSKSTLILLSVVAGLIVVVLVVVLILVATGNL